MNKVDRSNLIHLFYLENKMKAWTVTILDVNDDWQQWDVKVHANTAGQAKSKVFRLYGGDYLYIELMVRRSPAFDDTPIDYPNNQEIYINQCYCNLCNPIGILT